MYLSASAKCLGLLGPLMLLSVAAQSTFNFYAYSSSGDLSAVPLFYENGLYQFESHRSKKITTKSQ